MTEKLRPEVKKLWLNALRSGDYQQGHNRLCDTVKGVNKFCCLGVLDDLYKKENPKYIRTDQYYLTTEVQNWAFEDTEKLLKNPSVNDVTLSQMNDTGSSFNEIAQVIENNM